MVVLSLITYHLSPITYHLSPITYHLSPITYIMKKEKILFACTLVLILFVSGCSDGLIRVQGKVSYDGKPIQEGSVAFVGERGQGAVYGEQFTNGSYSARVPKGEYLIKINGFESVKLDQPLPGVAGSPPTTHVTKPIVPAKYNMLSQIFIEIDGSQKVFDFDLEKVEDSGDGLL